MGIGLAVLNLFGNGPILCEDLGGMGWSVCVVNSIFLHKIRTLRIATLQGYHIQDRHRCSMIYTAVDCNTICQSNKPNTQDQ